MTTVTAEQASEMASDLRDSADLLSAEHGPKEICEMEWQAADMIEAQAKRIKELEAAGTENAALKADNERLREAMTPSVATKAAYHGEFVFHEHYTDDDGNDGTRRVYVPWTTVKEIMAAIKSRAHEQRGS